MPALYPINASGFASLSFVQVLILGLLVLELHTINPIITASNLGNTAATAYDGTHGYSDQYIFEIDTMLPAAKEAGLTTEPKYQARYPNNNLATISINLFKVDNKY